MLSPPKTNQNRIHIAHAQKRVDKTLPQKHGLCVQEVTTLYRKARLKKIDWQRGPSMNSKQVKNIYSILFFKFWFWYHIYFIILLSFYVFLNGTSVTPTPFHFLNCYTSVNACCSGKHVPLPCQFLMYCERKCRQKKAADVAKTKVSGGHEVERGRGG